MQKYIALGLIRDAIRQRVDQINRAAALEQRIVRGFLCERVPENVRRVDLVCHAPNQT